MRELIKPIVFANPVNDLTMARYLAAMDVDFFGIDLDEPDERKIKMLIHQIREWVEGPKLIGVSSRPSKKMIEEYSLDGYYMDFEIELRSDLILFQSNHYHSEHPNSNPTYIIIENAIDCHNIQKCILKTSIYEKPVMYSDLSGFMISPGKEEKIGLYDFEKLDEWFGEVRK